MSALYEYPLVKEIFAQFPGAVLTTSRERMMVDPTENEIAAIVAAAPVLGEYVESIGKTDLAAMTEDEYMTAIEVVVTAYQDKLRTLCAPFK